MDDKDKIVIRDDYLADTIYSELRNKGIFNKEIIISKNNNIFPKNTLEAITELSLCKRNYSDISALKYCSNLENLEIISVNPKKISGREEYKSQKVNINDFSVISDLTNLKYLTISFCDGLEKINLSKLKNLEKLQLIYNENLKNIYGIYKLEDLKRLRLFSNENLSKNIYNFHDIIKNDSEHEYLIDVNLFSNDFNERDTSVTWAENLSNIRINKFKTSEIKEMYSKIQKVLNDIIEPNYSNYDKIKVIYAYTTNVTYDDKDYKELRNSEGELEEDRKHSSYNAIMKGKAVCEGYSFMMHYMLNMVGIESQTCESMFFSGRRYNPSNKGSYCVKDSDHRIIRVKFNDEWYYFDPTNDRHEPNKRYWLYFFNPKNEIEKNNRLMIREEKIDDARPLVMAPYDDKNIQDIISKCKKNYFYTVQEICNNDHDNKREYSNSEENNYTKSTISTIYSELYDDEETQNLAKMFGKLQYEQIQKNKDNKNSTDKKNLTGIKKTKDGDQEIYIAEYQRPIDEKANGKSLAVIEDEYFTLDENGEFIKCNGKNYRNNHLSINIDDIEKRLDERQSSTLKNLDEECEKKEKDQPIEMVYRAVSSYKNGIRKSYLSPCLDLVKDKLSEDEFNKFTTIEIDDARPLVVMDSYDDKNIQDIISKCEKNYFYTVQEICNNDHDNKKGYSNSEENNYTKSTISTIYSELYDDEETQNLAKMFGKLQYEQIQKNKDNKNSTDKKNLTEIKKTKDGDQEIYIAEYQRPIDEKANGKGLAVVEDEYFTLDENGEFIKCNGKNYRNDHLSVYKSINIDDVEKRLDERQSSTLKNLDEECEKKEKDQPIEMVYLVASYHKNGIRKSYLSPCLDLVKDKLSEDEFNKFTTIEIDD